MLKRIVSFCLFWLVLISSCALAHPGGTDENGGHYNRSTGEYHYHHGYPEHQHTNGKCPYDFDVATPRPTSNSTRATAVPKKSNSSDYSSSTKKVTAAPTVAPTTTEEPIGKELRMKIIIGLSAAVALLLTALIFTLRKNWLLDEKNIALNHDIYKLNREKDEQAAAASKEYLALEQKLASLHSQARENAKIRKDMEASRRSSAKWCNRYLELSDQFKVLSRALRDSEAENVILRTALNEQLQNLPVSEIEAHVFVKPSSSDKYHSCIHGSWHDYKLVPLRHAIAKKLSPCSVCFAPIQTPSFSAHSRAFTESSPASNIPISQTIVWVSEARRSPHYHARHLCENKFYMSGISLSDASLKRFTPCPVCKPPLPPAVFSSNTRYSLAPQSSDPIEVEDDTI